jgi:phospholipid transport system substrate-binding protein
MRITRRGVLVGAIAASAVTPALALDGAEARKFVETMGAELIEILRTAKPGAERADEFLDLFRRAAALPQIGRFTMGLNWRQMTEAQQAAFESHAVRSYTKSIGDYSGQVLIVTGTQDAGQRGVLVSSVLRAQGAQDVRLDWLVSDRSGKPQVVDVVAEGVSLAITQREEFAAMVEARRGDIDRFIADLRG